MFMKKLGIGLAVLALTGSCLLAEPAAPEASTTEETPAVETVKLTKKQLQGKLLYRKSQARKLERAAEEKSPELKEKIKKYNEEIRAAYVAAEPKLAEIYAIQDELQGVLNDVMATK